jgi:hypothetical protein
VRFEKHKLYYTYKNALAFYNSGVAVVNSDRLAPVLVGFVLKGKTAILSRECGSKRFGFMPFTQFI